MHIEEIIQKVKPLDGKCITMAQARFDALIKPVGSLAQLESMTSRYAGILGKYDKHEITYPKREILVWCAIDEAEQATKIMEAKWPVNVLAAQTGAKTGALLVTSESKEDALEEGATLVQELINEHGLGLLGFGCLSKQNEHVHNAMVGGILMAAAMGIPVILDGVEVCSAAKEAISMSENVRAYLFAGHISAEAGAEAAVADLGLQAPLRLNIPDGAGEGAALCFTLFDAGIKAYKEMETFEEAGVHAEVKDFSLHEQNKNRP